MSWENINFIEVYFFFVFKDLNLLDIKFLFLFKVLSLKVLRMSIIEDF